LICGLHFTGGKDSRPPVKTWTSSKNMHKNHFSRFMATPSINFSGAGKPME
jgi:hypothetical protein